MDLRVGDWTVSGRAAEMIRLIALHQHEVNRPADHGAVVLHFNREKIDLDLERVRIASRRVSA